MCDYPAIHETKDIKAARKQHRCSECFKPIEKGQPYQQYDALYNGAWGHSKFCTACQEAWKAIWSIDDHLCVQIGEAWNTLCDYGIAVPYWNYDHYRERAAI
jgi:hypothetical protein